MDRPNSIIQKLKNITKCEICFNDYNRRSKQPVIICSMHHTVCRECMVSLEHNPNCPFCRQKIRFDKVVVNNYINQLLPTEEIKPNTRVEVQNASPKAGYLAQASRFNTNQPARSFAVNQTYQTGPIMNREFSVPNHNGEFVRLSTPPPVVPPPAPVSINNQALQRVYDQNFHNRALQRVYVAQESVYEQDFHNRALQRVHDQDFHNREIEWDYVNESQSNLTIYKCIYMLQLPFTFLNLYFALSSPPSECMDKPRRSTVLVVRPWLMSMGIIEASLMLLFLLALFLFYKKVIEHQTFYKYKFILGALFLIKLLVWMFAELDLFLECISVYCSGGIFAYGVVMTIIHGLALLVLFCFGYINGRRS